MADITLGKSQNGQTVRVTVGDTITVRLEENPTTGYRWFVEPGSEAVLQSSGSKFVQAPGGGIGAGGERVLRFTVTAPGRTELKLKLWREWEGDASITERLTVTVDAR